MSCVYCIEGDYWVCDSGGSPVCDPIMVARMDSVTWVEVGEFEFEEGPNTVWCTPGKNCDAMVQDDDPGPSWKNAGTFSLKKAATGTVYCKGTGADRPCQVKVQF